MANREVNVNFTANILSLHTVFQINHFCVYTQYNDVIIQELNIDVLYCGPGEHCNETYIIWTALFYNHVGLNIGGNVFSR